MAELTLEQRVTELERQVAVLQSRAQPTTAHWWESIGRPMSSTEQEAFDRMAAYGRYFRKTGRTPPDNWNPGDPIPVL